MRHTGPRVAGAAFLAWGALAGWASPPAGAQGVDLTPSAEEQTVIVGGPSGQPGRTWGYRGKLSTGTRRWGSYRATCVWLGPSWTSVKHDDRVLCTIVLTARLQPSGTVVAQGLVKRPAKGTGLFARAYMCSTARHAPVPGCKPRTVPIIGGTGRYEDLPLLKYVLDLSTPDLVSITHPV